MNTFATMADQLQAQPQAPERPESGSKAGRMRQELQRNGPASSRRLADVAQLPTAGQVGALLKHDMRLGRVRFFNGMYEWNESHIDSAPRGPLRGDQEVITWIEAARELPDADLTVLVRTRGCEEPVWLGFWDGEGWRDIDTIPIQVVRWCELPKGGEAE